MISPIAQGRACRRAGRASTVRKVAPAGRSSAAAGRAAISKQRAEAEPVREQAHRQRPVPRKCRAGTAGRTRRCSMSGATSRSIGRIAASSAATHSTPPPVRASSGASGPTANGNSTATATKNSTGSHGPPRPPPNASAEIPSQKSGERAHAGVVRQIERTQPVERERLVRCDDRDPAVRAECTSFR